MNTTAKNNSSRKRRIFIGVKNYLRGLDVALLEILRYASCLELSSCVLNLLIWHTHGTAAYYIITCNRH